MTRRRTPDDIFYAQVLALNNYFDHFIAMQIKHGGFPWRDEERAMLQTLHMKVAEATAWYEAFHEQDRMEQAPGPKLELDHGQDPFRDLPSRWISLRLLPKRLLALLRRRRPLP